MPPKVLVANRGEIAIRILRSASELGWITVTIYTENDISHATFADEAVKLESVADFLNVGAIVNVAIRTQCTHLHPGYGFLSEDPSLPLALTQAGRTITFIGPSPSTLRIAFDKMLSRELATFLGVRIAPGIRVTSAAEVRAFAAVHTQGQSIGYPVMIKALDGGGGRGIRVVADESGVEEAFKRCLGESTSKQVFAEKALTGPGWKHIEVQVIGDGKKVNHLWERECSVQRRFQKVVEVAPSRLPRSAVQPLLDASLKMASHLHYKGLGTFEFLVNAHSLEWVFLEINPRVQVEHTVTEEITNIDLIRAQFLLFSPTNDDSLPTLDIPPAPPTSYAIQLRLTAEDPQRGFQLSPGTLRASDIVWPGGTGVRVDTWLSIGPRSPHDDGEGADTEWIVGTEFDSLLAKIIIRGASFKEATEKGLRSLRELRLGSGAAKIKTNVAVLAGTLVHLDWANGMIDTLWLERNATDVLTLGEVALRRNANLRLESQKRLVDANLGGKATPAAGGGPGGGNALLQPGALFHLTLSTSSSEAESAQSSSANNAPTKDLKHTITLTSIAQNAFPEVLSGTFLSSLPSPLSVSGGSSTSYSPIAFKLTQSTSISVSSGKFELADPNNSMHVAAPMTGKVVELHPALATVLSSTSSSSSSDSTSNSSPSKQPTQIKSRTTRMEVRKGDTLLVFSVMKMENVVVAPFDGFVDRVGNGLRVGVVLGEGMLVCVLERHASDEHEKARISRL